MLNRRRKDQLHNGFSHENVKHKNDLNAPHIDVADLYFLQALGRLR